jgi:hypothetical protein
MKEVFVIFLVALLAILVSRSIWFLVGDLSEIFYETPASIYGELQEDEKFFYPR